MTRLPGWKKWLSTIIEPGTSPVLDELLRKQEHGLPVLWLMGKAGAGKSSIIQRLTGDKHIQIGEGFAPCTLSAMYYDHPPENPVLRFLDTRGLGEANYNPEEDLAIAQQGSHALLIITRVDDVAQEQVVQALQAMKVEQDRLAMIQVHTALHTVSAESRSRAITFNHQQIEKALGGDIRAVEVDFTHPEDGFDDPDKGLSQLIEAIVSLVPELSRILTAEKNSSDEEELFLSLRNEVLGYASASAAADVLPAVGLLAVPSLQGKMLHTLAGRHGLVWNKRLASEFVAALGTSFLYRYLVSLGTRQLAKFIPVYGQSAGAAAAASISFASTYALGRTASLYFYRTNIGKPVDTTVLREAFVQAFKQSRHASKK